jgi:hypothetical protein
MVSNDPLIQDFLKGKSEHTLMLYRHFLSEFSKIGEIHLRATKSMIGIAGPRKNIAWVTQLGKNFIHVVFPFKEAHIGNLCFQKIVQVPGDTTQFNHHFRMLFVDDINGEVISFMKMAYET